MRVARSATLLLALVPALSWAQQTAPVPERAGDAASAEEAVTSRVPLEEIRRYVGVYNAVRAAYVEPVDDKKLMQSAIRGLLLDLDPHSTYSTRKKPKPSTSRPKAPMKASAWSCSSSPTTAASR